MGHFGHCRRVWFIQYWAAFEPRTAILPDILPDPCAVDASTCVQRMRASGDTIAIPGQRPTLSTSHSSTELREHTHTHTHTHGTETTHTNRPTHTGLTYPRAGNVAYAHVQTRTPIHIDTDRDWWCCNDCCLPRLILNGQSPSPALLGGTHSRPESLYSVVSTVHCTPPSTTPQALRSAQQSRLIFRT